MVVQGCSGHGTSLCKDLKEATYSSQPHKGIRHQQQCVAPGNVMWLSKGAESGGPK